MNEPKYKVGSTFVAKLFTSHLSIYDKKWDVYETMLVHQTNQDIDIFVITSVSDHYYHLINWKTKTYTTWKRSTVESPNFLLQWNIIPPRDE